MTLGQLRAQYGSGANMACRPIQRHGVVQGKKQKWASAWGLTATAPPPSSSPPTTCGQLIVRSRLAIREMCIVCISSFDRGEVGPRFVENWGHHFGHSSSVSNYWRTPLLCCQAARHFLEIPVDHYCDDYATPDFKLDPAPDCGAASGLAALHAALGLILPKPMALAQLRTKYGSGANMACRPIQRHGVVQGTKPTCDADGQPLIHPDGQPVMVDKIRLCDDSRRLPHNTHLTRTCETVAPCTFTYLAHVCECVVRRASERGLTAPPVVCFHR